MAHSISCLLIRNQFTTNLQPCYPRAKSGAKGMPGISDLTHFYLSVFPELPSKYRIYRAIRRGFCSSRMTSNN